MQGVGSQQDPRTLSMPSVPPHAISPAPQGDGLFLPELLDFRNDFLWD